MRDDRLPADESRTISIMINFLSWLRPIDSFGDQLDVTPMVEISIILPAFWDSKSALFIEIVAFEPINYRRKREPVSAQRLNN